MTRIYTIPLSHPGLAAVGMARGQGIVFREISLPAGLHPLILRAQGFRGLCDSLRQRQWFADVASPFPLPRVTGVLLTPLVPLFVAQ